MQTTNFARCENLSIGAEHYAPKSKSAISVDYFNGHAFMFCNSGVNSLSLVCLSMSS